MRSRVLKPKETIKSNTKRSVRSSKKNVFFFRPPFQTFFLLSKKTFFPPLKLFHLWLKLKKRLDKKKIRNELRNVLRDKKKDIKAGKLPRVQIFLCKRKKALGRDKKRWNTVFFNPSLPLSKEKRFCRRKNETVFSYFYFFIIIIPAFLTKIFKKVPEKKN